MSEGTLKTNVPQVQQDQTCTQTNLRDGRNQFVQNVPQVQQDQACTQTNLRDGRNQFVQNVPQAQQV
jgi:hypothetical protein